MELTLLDGLCLSDSPPERDVQWSQEGVSAAFKFVQKIWKLNNEVLQKKESATNSDDITFAKSC